MLCGPTLDAGRIHRRPEATVTPTLSLSYALPAPPVTLMALMRDRTFVLQRLAVLQATSAELVDHEVGEDHLVTTVVSTFPRSILPVVVRGFVRGEPRFRRTETWTPAADGFTGKVEVDLDGTPSTIAGEMALRPAGAGSELTFDCTVSIPIPVVGPHVEPVVRRQVTAIADAEAQFFRDWLSD
jgi:hypothetical protein